MSLFRKDNNNTAQTVTIVDPPAFNKGNQEVKQQVRTQRRDNKFYGLPDQDIYQPLPDEPTHRRIPGLSQEYRIKRSRYQPEVHTFKPTIKRWYRETDSRKKLLA